MKVYILKKSITDLKNPIIKKEFETNSKTVQDLIIEMVSKNYTNKIKDSLTECIKYAIEEFIDGSYYIINKTKDIHYKTIDEQLLLNEEDELILIKLKYVRGIIW